MLKSKPLILFLLCFASIHSQEIELPADLRQHNLSYSNVFVNNPAFSMNNERTNSVGVWTRWQWQQIDGDPTTLFLNYIGRLNNTSMLGGGFFQHNTGVYLNTGGVVNYAYEYVINPRASVTVGLNLFGYHQQLADSRFEIDPQIQLPQLVSSDGFLVQLAPGVQFTYDQLSIGFTSENMLLYNVTTKEGNAELGKRIFAGTIAYDLPVSFLPWDDQAIIRPMVYMKSIPGFDTQIGLNALLTTSKFWAQGGYNNFYGVSVGAGGRFKGFSLGAMVELSTDNALSDKDFTLELITSYAFGAANQGRKAIDLKPEEEKELIPEEDIAEVTDQNDALSKAELLAIKNEAKARSKSEKDRTKDSLSVRKKDLAAAERLKKRETRKANALIREKEAERLALSRKIAKQKKSDSLSALKKQRQLEVSQKRLAQYRRDSIQEAERKLAMIEEDRQKELDLQAAKNKLIEATAVIEREREQQLLDSIAAADRALALTQQKELEEQNVQQAKEDKPKAGERYEEAVSEDGLAPGYYLIANVFGTKRYYEAFMSDLTKKGLQPKSFYRNKNKYNYVYLGRYNSMSEARKARDGNLGGKYPDKTWIYRVVGN